MGKQSCNVPLRVVTENFAVALDSGIIFIATMLRTGLCATSAESDSPGDPDL